jgi:hypothetical protein
VIQQTLQQLQNVLRRLKKRRGTWILFYADSQGLKYPNFFPVMIHEHPEELRKMAEQLPTSKTGSYQLFFLPTNVLLPEVTLTEVRSMLGLYHHEHLTPEDNEDDNKNSNES